MKRTRSALVGLVVVTAIAFAMFIFTPGKIAAAGPDRCNDSTIAGKYGFAIGGLVSTTFNGNPQRIGDWFPLSAVGTFSFDGHGTTTRALTLSFGGQVFPVNDSGPYTVHSDCTVSATYSDGTWSMVIVSHGKEVKAMNASPGVEVQGVLTKQ